MLWAVGSVFIQPFTNGGINGDGIEAVRQTAIILWQFLIHNNAASKNRVTKVDDMGNIQWARENTYLNAIPNQLMGNQY